MTEEIKNNGTPGDVTDSSKEGEGDVSGYAMSMGMASLGAKSDLPGMDVPGADIPLPVEPNAMTLIGSGEGKPPQPPTMPPVVPPTVDGPKAE
jgi:hypothetical protein